MSKSDIRRKKNILIKKNYGYCLLKNEANLNDIKCSILKGRKEYI